MTSAPLPTDRHPFAPPAAQLRPSSGQPAAQARSLTKVFGSGPSAVTALDEAESNPAFTALSAVQDGHVVTVDGSEWMSLGGPIAAMNVLGDVQKALGR